MNPERERLLSETYVAHIQAAELALRAGRPFEASQHLQWSDVERRGWDWAFLDRRVQRLAENFAGHEGEVRSLAWSSDGTHLLSSAEDRTLRLWTVNEGRERLRIQTPEERVPSAIAVSPEGKRIAAQWGDEEIRVWTSEEGTPLSLRDPGGVSALCFSPDGERLFCGSHDGTLKGWSLPEREEILSVSPHFGSLYALRVDDSGRFLASGGYDNSVRVHDLETSQEVAVFEEAEETIRSLDFDSEAKRLVIGSEDGHAYVWSLDSSAFSKWPHREKVVGVGFVDDASLDLIVTVTLNGHRTVRDLQSSLVTQQDRWSQGSLGAMSFSPNGETLSLSAEDSIRLWHQSEEAPSEVWSAGTGTVWTHDSDRSENLIATGGSRGKLQIRDLRLGEDVLSVRTHRRGLNDVAFSHDGTRIATGGPDRKARIFDVKTGEELEMLEGHDRPIVAVAWTSQDDRLVTVDNHATIKVWDLSTSTCTYTKRGPRYGVLCLELAEDATLLVWASAGGNLRGWNPLTGKKVFGVRHDALGQVSSLALSADGERLAAGSRFEEDSLKVFDWRSGRVTEFQGSDGRVHAVALSPDGRRVVSGTERGVLQVWDVETGRELLHLRGPEGPVRRVALTHSGRSILVAGPSDLVQIWPTSLVPPTDELNEPEPER